MYLLHFDFEYNKALQNAKWRKLLDPNDTKEKNFYFVNRHTLGNPFYLVKRCVVLSCALVFLYGCIDLITYFWFENIHNFKIHWGFILIILISVIIFITRIWLKLPQYDDNWHIKDEFRLVNLCLAASCIGSGAFIALIVFYELPLYWALVLVETAGWTVIVYIMTLHVIKQNTRNNNNNNDNNNLEMTKSTKKKKKKSKTRSRNTSTSRSNNDKSTALTADVDGKTKDNDDNDNDSSDSEDEMSKLTWRDVIQSQQGYDLLMNFLGKELSTENLLFITEVEWFFCFCFVLLFAYLVCLVT